MRRISVLAAALTLALALVPATASAKHDKTYATAQQACRSLPLDKLRAGLGLPSDAGPAAIANAYAKRQKRAATRKSAHDGCLAGLKAHA